MKLNLRKPFAVIMGAVMALTTVSAASAANIEAAMNDSYEIVALGDSITVGYEQRMTEESVPYGYVDRLYEQALFHGRATLSNYAIMGLTTPGLGNLLQGASESAKMTSADIQDFSSFQEGVSKQADAVASKAPEIALSLRTADLVVMTIGANDFGELIKAMTALSTEDAQQMLDNNFDTIMNKYTTDLDKVIRQLHVMAPNAQILLSDQYLPLWSTHKLYGDLLKAVDKLADRLDVVTDQLSKEGLPMKVVHISPSFKGKETTYTYVNTFDYDNHPKQAGYEVIAEAYANVIWNQYLKPAPRAADVPISVIISGKDLLSKPILKNNTTFLAIRDFSKAVNADLEWIDKTKTAIFRKNGREVSITIGSKTMIVNGVKQPLETPAYIQKIGTTKSTYVPLAVIIKGLNYDVIYRGRIKTAFINS
ncbi:stalk domain-containing protein [Cohnella sp.]|uniref:stalk domain-containing protein n=1 Tax=Cohnella sp. TaxID=1883426 RepID=UPI0035654EEE